MNMKISERAGKILRLTMSIATLVMLVVSAVLFVISSISINATGTSPYTYASIGAAFRKIAIPVYITIALVIASGIVFTFIAPVEKGRVKAMKDGLHRLSLLYRNRGIKTPERPTNTLKNMLDRINSIYVYGGDADDDVVKTVKFERTLRSGMKLANVLLFVAGVVTALVIGIFNKSLYLDGNSYQALTQSVVNVVVLVVICLAPAMVFAIVRFFIDKTSVVREYAAVEKLPRTRGEKALETQSSFNILNGVRIAIIAIALRLIWLGIFNGGMEDVVQKAIKICTECIGLG